jgi:hypothetical protein
MTAAVDAAEGPYLGREIVSRRLWDAATASQSSMCAVIRISCVPRLQPRRLCGVTASQDSMASIWDVANGKATAVMSDLAMGLVVRRL